jgi:hypothetical protein
MKFPSHAGQEVSSLGVALGQFRSVWTSRSHEASSCSAAIRGTNLAEIRANYPASGAASTSRASVEGPNYLSHLPGLWGPFCIRIRSV